jgi:endonuclease-3
MRLARLWRVNGIFVKLTSKGAAMPTKSESAADLKARARAIIAILRKAYPGAKCTLDFKNPVQLLIATILSAQCTDKLVNSLSPKLFAKYRTVADWAKAPLAQIETDIKPTGFFHNKAKSIQGCCQELIASFGGEVPDNMEDLVKLPGVGRKTANVILAAIWGRPAVIVDTHVTRVAARLGLTTQKTADKIEMELQQILPEKDWSFFSHAIILHGRNICTAKKPACPACPLNKLCPSAFTFG